MFKLLKSAVCAAILSGAATLVQAQDLPQNLVESLMTQCRPDYHRLCPDVLPGGGRVGRCLKDQEERLSPGCLKAVKFAHAITVCMPDYKRYCNGLPVGDERIVSCLAQNYGALLPECERIVRANEPYLDRADPYRPRHSEYGNGDRNRSYYYGENRSYPDSKQYGESYHRSYQDKYNGDGRYLGRSYYNNDKERADDQRRAYEDDGDRETIK